MHLQQDNEYKKTCHLTEQGINYTLPNEMKRKYETAGKKLNNYQRLK
jgi:hypothetical protein